MRPKNTGMSKRLLLFLAAVLQTCTLLAGTVKGKVIDAATGEAVIGATVLIKGDGGSWAVTGLDGSFTLDTDTSSGILVCSLVGYKDSEITFTAGSDNILALEQDIETLDAVVITASCNGRSDMAARNIERNSASLVNVMSAKAMELSPDITVANVIKRMSGVTVERNSSGEGQYAILRGMDKRYNYTLVNGIKIPSPDNKNRFVPLDIFPSEILDRIEVTKSLTADMEGDGIAGAVNLVMKDAPEKMEITASLSTGYSALFIDRPFQSFNYRAINPLSPNEIKGRPELHGENYSVTADDFTMDNLHMTVRRPRPDITGGFSYGDRFFNGRLGIIAAISYQNLSRGKDSEIYYIPGSSGKGTENRTYSDGQSRIGAHAKLDYRFSDRHKVMLYAGYMDLEESEVRDGANDVDRTVRMRWNRQYIVNTTLKGEHMFLRGNRLTLDWTGAWSKAYSTTPDNTRIYINGNHLYNTNSADRRWEHNSDRDIAGYVNLSYRFDFSANSTLTFKAGGMYRDKVRSSFFNEYTFDSPYGISHLQYYGKDWTNFDELVLEPRPYGNVGDPLNYDASEKIGAAYLMGTWKTDRFELIAGIRAEHTDQGYRLIFPRETDGEGRQIYTDILPSIHLKYGVHRNACLRLSYGRSTNRPGFFEIVPYTILNEDYDEKGNPDLQHTTADNIDLRYEFFPGSSEQFMAGLFWKKLYNPIEYGLITEGQATFLTPMNFGNAVNAGIEVDIMKYFNWFGIKANYTYTHSSITTTKRTVDENNVVVDVTQTRPLYGQAAHVANLSLLFKFAKAGIEAQISGNYTGRRLSEISNWLDNDIWEAGYIQLDASLEKSFRCGITLYAKANNLLDMPVLRYIVNNPRTENLKDYERYRGGVIERREWHGQTLMIGIRYSFKEK